MNDDKRDDLQPKHEPASGGEGLVADRARRRLTGAGLGAPILMTLMSQPALGAQCLSNMLSGNLSDPNRGSCSKGWSPGGWGLPGGTVHNYSTLGAWTKAGYVYGVLTFGANPNQVESYTGGSLLSSTPFTLPPGASASLTMREVLQPPYSGSLQFHLVAAWLNAKLSENDSTYQYILTPAQVVGLANGTIPIPGGMSLIAFLDSTW